MHKLVEQHSEFIYEKVYPLLLKRLIAKLLVPNAWSKLLVPNVCAKDPEDPGYCRKSLKIKPNRNYISLICNSDKLKINLFGKFW